jgi:hypothetical protein
MRRFFLPHLTRRYRSQRSADVIYSSPAARSRIPIDRILTAPIASLGSATAVRPIKNIAPPIINPGNRLARSDKGNPKNHFKNHVNALQYISEK